MLCNSGAINVGAAATATVSAAGTITSINNYKCRFRIFWKMHIKFPPTICVGVGTTAAATATITNGAVHITTITNPGLRLYIHKLHHKLY